MHRPGKVKVYHQIHIQAPADLIQYAHNHSNHANKNSLAIRPSVSAQLNLFLWQCQYNDSSCGISLHISSVPILLSHLLNFTGNFNLIFFILLCLISLLFLFNCVFSYTDLLQHIVSFYVLVFQASATCHFKYIR